MAKFEEKRPPRNAFERFWRKVYHPLGFYKGYNFPLWIICGGALFAFSLARLFYLDISGTFSKKAAPGEWYWYHSGFRRVGITLHLATILPLGLLVPWQFLPIIRHKFIIVHRINGYVNLTLLLLSNAGVYMITRRAMGGSPATQAGIGTLATLTLIFASLAYYNIKRLQIDQHRAWMLRTFVIMACIITLRPLMSAASAIMSRAGTYFSETSCPEILFNYAFFGATGPRNPTPQLYPVCRSPANLTASKGHAAVNAGQQLPEQIAAGLHMGFGMGIWVCMFIHLIAVEVYLSLTTAEAQRLRVVSYEKQLKAGLRHPGSAGLTADRWGDVEAWQPPVRAVEETTVAVGK